MNIPNTFNAITDGVFVTRSAARLGFVALVALLTESSSLSVASTKAAQLKDWPTIQSAVKRNEAMEQRIAAIVAAMTLDQKVGQITQADIRSITPDQVRRYYIGSILNGGGAWPDLNKHAAIADWTKLSDQFYRASMATGMKTPIPVIWGTDAVHGHSNVYGEVLYPHNIALGAAHDPKLIERIAKATAQSVRATGITWVFAPTLAVVQNPRWGRTYESYSSDPALVRSYAEHFVLGMQGSGMASGTAMGDQNTIATAKHFLGDGGTYLGKDQGETRANQSDLMNVHAQGYYAAIAAGVQTVMVSYSSVNDVAAGKNYGKMHGASALLTDALKTKMGFDGLVVSDWNAIEQVPGCTRTHCPQSINAGVDLVMVPDDWQQFIVETKKDVETGAIPMQRLDDAVTRILRVKMRSGLFDKAPAATTGAPDTNENRTLAREAVRKSLVLMKNNSGTLPLKATSRVLVVGEAANRMDRQTGGWSLTWQGSENDNSDFPGATTVLAAIKQATSGTVDYSLGGKGVDVSKYDVIVAVASETAYAEMKGDIIFPAPLTHSIRYPADLAMLKSVSGKRVPVVTILLSGRPVSANDLINLSDAFVAAWLPGSEAGGIADVLFRSAKTGAAQDFQGRLSFDWPSAPCPRSDGPSVQFKRGYGLTYAKPVPQGTLIDTVAPDICAAGTR
jgi:beta-glucosidase